jgi:hypothetical protein
MSFQISAWSPAPGTADFAFQLSCHMLVPLLFSMMLRYWVALRWRPSIVPVP